MCVSVCECVCVCRISRPGPALLNLALEAGCGNLKEESHLSIDSLVKLPPGTPAHGACTAQHSTQV